MTRYNYINLYTNEWRLKEKFNAMHVLLWVGIVMKVVKCIPVVSWSQTQTNPSMDHFQYISCTGSDPCCHGSGTETSILVDHKRIWREGEGEGQTQCVSGCWRAKGNGSWRSEGFKRSFTLCTWLYCFVLRLEWYPYKVCWWCMKDKFNTWDRDIKLSPKLIESPV